MRWRFDERRDDAREYGASLTNTEPRYHDGRVARVSVFIAVADG